MDNRPQVQFAFHSASKGRGRFSTMFPAGTLAGALFEGLTVRFRYRLSDFVTTACEEAKQQGAPAPLPLFHADRSRITHHSVRCNLQRLIPGGNLRHSDVDL